MGIDISAFIAKVAEEDMEGAYQVLSASSALPAVCGRVCPQENQCESKCVRGIKGEPVGIGRLELGVMVANALALSGAARRAVLGIEVDHYLLALELRQADGFFTRRRDLEIVYGLVNCNSH